MSTKFSYVQRYERKFCTHFMILNHVKYFKAPSSVGPLHGSLALIQLTQHLVDHKLSTYSNKIQSYERRKGSDWRSRVMRHRRWRNRGGKTYRFVNISHPVCIATEAYFMKYFTSALCGLHTWTKSHIQLEDFHKKKLLIIFSCFWSFIEW